MYGVIIMITKVIIYFISLVLLVKNRIYKKDYTLMLIILFSALFGLLDIKHTLSYNLVFVLINFIKNTIVLFGMSSILSVNSSDKKQMKYKWLVMPLIFFAVLTSFHSYIFRFKLSKDYIEFIKFYNSSLKGRIYIIISSIVIAPISEELFYRYGISGAVHSIIKNKKSAFIYSLIISTVCFTISHSGIYDIDAIKFIQVIPMGILLYFIYYNYGLRRCMLSHSIYNIVILLINTVLKI